MTRKSGRSVSHSRKRRSRAVKVAWCNICVMSAPVDAASRANPRNAASRCRSAAWIYRTGYILLTSFCNRLSTHPVSLRYGRSRPSVGGEKSRSFPDKRQDDTGRKNTPVVGMAPCRRRGGACDCLRKGWRFAFSRGYPLRLCSRCREEHREQKTEKVKMFRGKGFRQRLRCAFPPAVGRIFSTGRPFPCPRHPSPRLS